MSTPRARCSHRNIYMQCEPRNRTPCDRCAANQGNLNIHCVRGEVCILVDEVPFLCHLRSGADHLPHLPRVLQDIRRRRRHDRSKCKKTRVRDPDHPLFSSIVTTTVPNINSFNPFKELDFNLPELPYDDLISDIVWELEDNQTAAEVMGVGSIEDLVALLEAACLLETRFGHHDRTKRLIYSAMQLMLHCLEGLRLLNEGLLAANTHVYCTQATGCICPVFHALTKYGARYTEALTKALFSKKRDSDGIKIWPMVFYSLCLQAHVRRALMTMETHLHFTFSSLVVLGSQPRTHTYLLTALTLFEQISLQKDRRLAIKVSNALAQIQPSIYLKEAGIIASNINWGNWSNEQENIPRYLRRIFAVNHDPQQPIHPLARGPPPNLDYNLEVPLAPPPMPPPPLPPPPMETMVNVVAADHGSDVNMTSNEAPVLMAAGITTTAGGQFHGVRGVPDPHRDDDIASFFTRTSHAANSDRGTLDSMSLAGSSFAGSLASTATYVAPRSIGSPMLYVPMGENFVYGYDANEAFDHNELAQSWDISYQQQQNKRHLPP